MERFLVDFQKMNWTSFYPGQMEKSYTEGSQRIRLVQLTDEYAEEEWCEKEHLGYVLEGRISIVFADKSVTFKQGDGIFIPKDNKHKGKIAKNEKALIIFVEKV